MFYFYLLSNNLLFDSFSVKKKFGKHVALASKEIKNVAVFELLKISSLADRHILARFFVILQFILRFLVKQLKGVLV